MKHPVILALILSVAALPACAPHYVRALQPIKIEQTTQPERLTSHVLLISVDGLRPDAIKTYGAPTLSRLISEGSHTLSATTIMPSKTLPSHTSMLTGQPPERHGVLWNSHSPTKGEVEIPTVFGVLRAKGHKTAAFFSKSKFQHLQQQGTLDYSQAPGGWFGRWRAERTVRDASAYLTSERPHMLFVHLGDVDAAGHSSGWMSPAYGRAVQSVDASISQLLTSAEKAFGAGNYTVIVTADHGGHEKDHGSSDPRDVTIPWIAWGRGVHPGAITADVQTMDSASTVLWLLGESEPTDWVGDPVTGAFRNADLTRRD